MAPPDRVRLRAPALLALLLPLAAAMAGPADRMAPTVATPDDIAQDFLAVPCDNAQRQAAVRALYERMAPTRRTCVWSASATAAAWRTWCW